MNNIIIRVIIGEGDMTFLCDRTKYMQLSKSKSKIIFAIEYPDEKIARAEINNK